MMTMRIAAVLVAWMALAEGLRAQPPVQQPPDREITHVRGDLYQVRDGRRYTIVVKTTDGLILGDPLSTGTAAWLKTELESRFPGLPIRYVLVTQHHFARAEGLGIFTGATESVAQERYNDALNRARDRFDISVAALDRNRDGKLDERELSGAADGIELSEHDRNRDRTLTPKELYGKISNVQRHFDRRWRIALGGSAVEMVHVGSTESPEMSVIYLPKDRIVVTSGTPPLTLQDGFGTFTPRDALAWARAVDALEFDTMLTADGRTVQHADITAFSRYVANLLDVVADGHEAGRTAANLQASTPLERYRNTPFYAGRQAQIASAFADLRLTNVDFYGAAVGRMVPATSAFCAGYSECESTNRVGGATVGLRLRRSRVGVIGEAMFGIHQRESVRSTPWRFEHAMHRDTRGSVLASFGSTSPGFSIAALAGASFTVTDTRGLAMAGSGVLVQPGGDRRPIAADSSQWGLTTGIDMSMPMGRRFALEVPLRVTWKGRVSGDGDEAGTGSLDAQVGLGLSMRVSSRVRRPQ